MKIVFLPLAKEQLLNVFDLIAIHSEKAAVKTYNNILDEIDRLIGFPKIAKVEEKLNDLDYEFRSLVVLRRYKVVYFIKESTIFISMIWDCRMNPKDFRNKVVKSLK